MLSDVLIFLALRLSFFLTFSNRLTGTPYRLSLFHHLILTKSFDRPTSFLSDNIILLLLCSLYLPGFVFKVIEGFLSHKIHCLIEVTLSSFHSVFPMCLQEILRNYLSYNYCPGEAKSLRPFCSQI